MTSLKVDADFERVAKLLEQIRAEGEFDKASLHGCNSRFCTKSVIVIARLIDKDYVLLSRSTGLCVDSPVFNTILSRYVHTFRHSIYHEARSKAHARAFFIL